MLEDDSHITIEQESRSSLAPLSSFVLGQKKDDVVFFRMDTPSQLEKEYDFGAKLGEGTFGAVYHGIRKHDNAKCAIKKILRERTYSISERARLDREISILRLVRHPGIIDLFAVAESPSFLFLITELCEGSSLEHCLEQLPHQIGLEEHVAAEITRQVAAALSYLHNRGIVHRDLKAGNIMLLHKVALGPRRLSSELERPDETETPNTAVSLLEAKLPTDDTPPLNQQSNVPTDVQSQHQASTPNNPKDALRTPIRTYNNRGRAKRSAPAAITGKSTRESISRKLPNSTNTSTVTSNTPTSAPARHTDSLRPMVRLSNKFTPCTLRTKLIDFGLAIEVRKNEEALDNQCGTPLYMAPEVLMGRSYTRQCDVWSLGILIHQLLTCQLPFNVQNEEQLLEKLSNFDAYTVTRRLKHVTSLGQDCLARVLHMDPAYRYSASELLYDPWLAQFPSVHMTGETNHLDGSTELQYNHLSQHQRVSLDIHDHVTELAASRVCSDSRPPSVGVTHASSTHSTTNVLELMKQYHKELTGLKQEGGETSEEPAATTTTPQNT